MSKLCDSAKVVCVYNVVCNVLICDSSSYMLYDYAVVVCLCASVSVVYNCDS